MDMQQAHRTHARPRMQAMLLDRSAHAVSPAIVPQPIPGDHDLLLRVRACGICRTDLHIVDHDLPLHKSPLTPGHEIVGEVVQKGRYAEEFSIGNRVGVPWLGKTCGQCSFCRNGQENLCDRPLFTGYDLDGGFAQFAVADSRYCLAIPDKYDDLHAAPLLCAGLIGYRAYMTATMKSEMRRGEVRRIGFYGFGAAAHILVQVAACQGKEIYAFTRPGDERSQGFARALGACWAGDSEHDPPVALDAAILFAPSGPLVPRALRAVRKGGVVVCAGIHMSDIPSFPYELLWGERIVCSVANLTRADGQAFMKLAESCEIRTAPVAFSMQELNYAFSLLRAGQLDGAAVLVPEPYDRLPNA